MQEKIIEEVMLELLEEQKIGNLKSEELKTQLTDATNEVKSFKDHLQAVKLNVPPINTSQMEKVLNTNLDKTSKVVSRLVELIEIEREKQTIKEKCHYWMGWILLTLVLIIVLVVAIRWNSYRSF